MIYRTESRRYRMEDGTSYRGWDLVGFENGAEALRVADMTEDRRFAELLCAALNREKAEPMHITDIISDFLSDSEWKNSLLHGQGVIY